MKTINAKNLLAGCIIAVAFVSCGPTSVAVRSRPAQTVYVRPAQPRAGYIWVGDDYRWRGNRYEYRPGYWTAPQQNRVYVQGYWRNERRGDTWVPGHWQRR